jgi:hypothetical protein
MTANVGGFMNHSPWHHKGTSLDAKQYVNFSFRVVGLAFTFLKMQF